MPRFVLISAGVSTAYNRFIQIVTRPTPSTTHIVFKSGHQSTLTKHALYDDPKPSLVGIGWVVECVEKREHIGEERFKVKTDEVSALDLKKARATLILVSYASNDFISTSAANSSYLTRCSSWHETLTLLAPGLVRRQRKLLLLRNVRISLLLFFP